MTENSKHTVENQELQDIFTIEHALGDFSARIMRWGISLSAVMILAFIFITWLIRYPDTLVAEGAISSLDPPIQVIAPRSERIKEIHVANAEKVNPGDVLAVYQTDADPAHIFKVDELIVGTPPFSSGHLPDSLRLGSIAPFYQKFRSRVLEKEALQELDITERQLHNLRVEVGKTEQLLKVMARQADIFLQEIELMRKDVDRTTQLVEKGAVPKIDLEKQQAQLLAKAREAESVKLATINKQILVQQLNTKALELAQNRSEEFLELDRAIRLDLQALRTSLQEWKNVNLLRSPIKGEVAFPLGLSPGFFLESGALFCTVIPGDSAVSVIRARLPAAGAGAIRKGQSALLHLDNYPSTKYGTLAATVTEISILPASSQYEVKLDLVNGWVSNIGVRIHPQQNLPLQAEILTEEYSLIQRIFHYFTDQFKTNKPQSP